MKRMKVFIGALCFAAAGAAQAGYVNGVELDKKYSAFERVMHHRGSGLDSMESGYFVGYVVSIADMLSFEKKICLPAGVTAGQLADVAGRHNRSLTAAWEMDGSTIVLGALLVSFPCKK